MQTPSNNRRHLEAEDFIALRSLARHRWVQGDTISWKFNRKWCSVPFSEAALDAAYRLMTLGLAEETICCSGCSRSVIRLTQEGIAMASRLDGKRAIQEPLILSMPSSSPKGWLTRFWRALAPN